MLGLSKRSVSYAGLDCLKDVGTPQYMFYRERSHDQVGYQYQENYGHYTAYFGLAVLAVAAIKHSWFLSRDYIYRRRPSSSMVTSMVDVLVAYSRFVGYKQLPPALSYFTSLPRSVGSSLFMFVSAFYMLCLCFVPHYWYRGCRGFGSPPLAVRAGIMATSLTPFIYVMSGKSNMISVLTGISYEKLNVFHQYTGVAAFTLALIHTLPYVRQNSLEGGAHQLYVTFIGDRTYATGIAPLILLGVLCIASKAVVRKYIYETFWHLHWMCGFAYYGTMVWHVNNRLNCEKYMWSTLGFWGFQLIYRILVKTAFKPNKLFLKPRKAILKRLDDGTYEAVIANTHGYTWKPGQHVFLRFVGTRFLDNHPFSVTSVKDNESEEMKFIILPKGGLTKTLFDQLEDYVVNEKSVFIDGPYGGTTRDPTTFERVVLMATGTGITATLPYLSFLSNNIRDLTGSGNYPIITRGINFVWVVKHHDDIAWVRKELDRCQAIAGDYINIDIYVSRDHQPTFKSGEISVEVKQQEKTIHETETQFSVSSNGAHFNVHNYKPDLKLVLRELAVSFSRRNIIVSSGSDSMRAAISSEASRMQGLVFNTDLNKNSIEEIFLHSESFGW